MAGNFHIAPGRSYQQGNMHIHDLSPFSGQNFDLSHTIHKLAYGREYPGLRNPLDGAVVTQKTSPDHGSSGGLRTGLRRGVGWRVGVGVGVGAGWAGKSVFHGWGWGGRKWGTGHSALC